MFLARIAVLVAAVVLLAGCGAVKSAQEDADMHAVAVAWNAYHDANKGGPDNWDQFIEFAERDNNLNQNALIRARDAGWQMKWSKRIRDLLKPEHEPLQTTVMIGSSSDGRRLYLDGIVR
jgi:hypothetical protein